MEEYNCTSSEGNGEYSVFRGNVTWIKNGGKIELHIKYIQKAFETLMETASEIL